MLSRRASDAVAQNTKFNSIVPSAGSMVRMAKDKVTITLDRRKANDARSLVGASSTAEVIDIALERLIRAERKIRDVAAYRRPPATKQEDDLALLSDAGGLADETDWETLYADTESRQPNVPAPHRRRCHPSVSAYRVSQSVSSANPPASLRRARSSSCFVAGSRLYAATSLLLRSARISRSRAMSMTSEVEDAPTRERASFAFLRSRVIVTLSFAIRTILPAEGTIELNLVFWATASDARRDSITHHADYD